MIYFILCNISINFINEFYQISNELTLFIMDQKAFVSCFRTKIELDQISNEMEIRLLHLIKKLGPPGGKGSFCIHSACKCKKFKQIPLHWVGFGHPYHFMVSLPLNLHSQNDKVSLCPENEIKRCKGIAIDMSLYFKVF